MRQSLNITVDEAARLLDASPAWIRSACKRNILGDAYSSGGKRWTCRVSDGKVADWLGWSAGELEKAVKEIRNEI